MRALNFVRRAANSTTLLRRELFNEFKSKQPIPQEVSSLLKKLGVKAKAYQTDLTQEEQVKKLVENIYTDFRSIDVLVNAAAAFKKISLEKISSVDVEFFFKVNTLSVFLCSKYSIKKYIFNSLINKNFP